MPSITGNLVTSGLPDFRQGALWLRTLFVANLAMVLSILAANRDWAHMFAEFTEIAILLEPLLLLNLAVLSLVSEWLTPLLRRTGRGMVLLLVLMTAALLSQPKPTGAKSITTDLVTTPPRPLIKPSGYG